MNIKNISRILSLTTLIFSGLLISACTQLSNGHHSTIEKPSPERLAQLSRAYFASGCFWCVEAIFESVNGVEEAVSGYAGGSAADANYRAVAAGLTRHAETVEVYYDSTVVDYPTLLKVFFGSHDPTTLNRQGPDAGPQYRSAIFYQNDSEKNASVAYRGTLEKAGVFSSQIVTEITPLEKFYPAEDYHQDYERKNPYNPYIQAVSIPRLKKFQAQFPDLLRATAAH